ncbi:hypothetical protein NE237_013627 [Protea cynaroides]|uniref:EF-hand domain-containing protein n=1 Tax=Protea cynaroides TaxID=273540 RepID=A0A9Q0H494_9MAGN|nr:hypothetical protein NE237_013627 [Protea cynaroides]
MPDLRPQTRKHACVIFLIRQINQGFRKPIAEMVRAGPCDSGHEDEGVPEYERQRLSRIRENRERLEALGLPNLASNLLSSVTSVSKQSKRKGKEKKSEDEEYQPSSAEDDGASTSSEEHNEEKDGKSGDDVPSGSSRVYIRKGKNKSKIGKATKKVTLKKEVSGSDYIDNDAALQKAIALSLEGLTEVSDVQRRGGHIQDDAGNKKRRKKHTARVQMTEDEVILHFYQFDEAGKGRITLRDLQRIAIAHDFTWTDKEMMDMIDSFDGDGDGMLNLDDFRRIVLRCNMIQGCENAAIGSKS